MRLVTIASVRNNYGFEDMPDINAAIEAALEQTTPWLEAKFESVFDETPLTTRYYMYDYERPTPMAPPNTVLYLESGFVQSGSITVKSAYDWTEFTGGAAATITTMNPVARDGLVKGLLQDTETWFGAENFRLVDYGRAGPCLQVEYTVGFEADASDPDLYSQAQVPSFLKSAAQLNAMIMLENHPVVKNSDIDQDTGLMRDRLATLIKRYGRYAPHAKLPL